MKEVGIDISKQQVADVPPHLGTVRLRGRRPADQVEGALPVFPLRFRIFAGI